MLSREDFLSLNFVKKEDFTGSHKGMRFMLHQETVEEEKKLKVYIWSEPFGFEATPDEEKIAELFEFSEEGLAQAIDWMNENNETIAKKQPT
ncbi:MAG: hypothetical protein K2K74_19580 [Lachnospiraceae bacterium]|nr:hypothetical protein [Lachnospiraceae bacterium]